MNCFSNIAQTFPKISSNSEFIKSWSADMSEESSSNKGFFCMSELDKYSERLSQVLKFSTVSSLITSHTKCSKNTYALSEIFVSPLFRFCFLAICRKLSGSDVVCDKKCS